MTARDGAKDIWNSKWWLEAHYTELLGETATPEDIDRLVQRVTAVFSARWANQVESHPFLYSFLATGTIPLEFILGLGKDLVTMEGALRFGSLVKDLKHPSNCGSARLELEIAALLKWFGHTIEFRPPLPNGKESDLRCQKEGQIAYFEIKQMRESVKQKGLNALGYAISIEVSRITRDLLPERDQKRGYRVTLNDDLVPEYTGDAIRNATITKRIVKLIKAEAAARPESGLPMKFELPGIAEVELGLLEKDTSVVKGVVIPPAFELNRFLRGHFPDAVTQIHPNHPGIIVVQTPGLLYKPHVESILNMLLTQNSSKVGHVCAVLFFPTFFGLGQRSSMFNPFCVLNPASQYSPGTLLALQDLEMLFTRDAATEFET